jgi:hypothetical protein
MASENIERNILVRYSENIEIKKEVMAKPFMYIDAQFGYDIKTIYRRLLSQSQFDLGVFPNTFPNTIYEYYWVQEGNPTLEPWIAIGRLENGLYFYYKAFTNEPDAIFSKGGNMDLWLSITYRDLIQFVMDSQTYDKYINETSPPLEY